MQDNLSNPTQIEEPAALAQVPDHASQQDQAATPQPSVESDTNVSELAEINSVDDGEDQIAANEAEESEDSEGESDTPELASQTNDSPAIGDSNPTPASEQKATEDDRCEIAKQPYEFDHCTVQIAIQLLPDDGDSNGRMVVVGTRSHLDAPILRFIRLNELGALPPIVNALLDQLKSELPSREQIALAALEKKKEEQAKRQANLSAPRTKTTTRGKKTTKADALSSVPTSNATTDNRPRPEVNVPTNPQQQIGLF
ncbi:hypothetical protein ANRL1_00994 [Anaerolineae bacterium]|nr:hypothetical protein ANRL1_00994 [Anaerolineae bacterium]